MLIWFWNIYGCEKPMQFCFRVNAKSIEFYFLKADELILWWGFGPFKKNDCICDWETAGLIWEDIN